MIRVIPTIQCDAPKCLTVFRETPEWEYSNASYGSTSIARLALKAGWKVSPKHVCPACQRARKGKR